MSTQRRVWVFPGQGSQFKGMGADLFARYPRLVSQPVHLDFKAFLRPEVLT